MSRGGIKNSEARGVWILGPKVYSDSGGRETSCNFGVRGGVGVRELVRRENGSLSGSLRSNVKLVGNGCTKTGGVTGRGPGVVGLAANQGGRRIGRGTWALGAGEGCRAGSGRDELRVFYGICFEHLGGDRNISKKKTERARRWP